MCTTIDNIYCLSFSPQGNSGNKGTKGARGFSGRPGLPGRVGINGPSGERGPRVSLLAILLVFVVKIVIDTLHRVLMDPRVNKVLEEEAEMGSVMNVYSICHTSMNLTFVTAF